jgi:hypothetical protein
MLTLWVVSVAGRRPRRVHRWRIGDNKTVCGSIHMRQMRPIRTYGGVPNIPNLCHGCFKYRYRFDSMKGMQH